MLTNFQIISPADLAGNFW